MVAAMEVVVVLPWLPATAMPYFSRISSASSSPRGITGIRRRRASCTSGILLVDGGTDHQRARAADVRRRVAFVDSGAHLRQALGDRRQLQIGAADGVAEIQQHLGDAAHADPADPREMQMLRPEKHFLIVLFRLARQCQLTAVRLPQESRPRACAAPGRANCLRRLAHPFQLAGVARQLRDHREQLLSVHFCVRAPGAPRRPARMASALRVW